MISHTRREVAWKFQGETFNWNLFGEKIWNLSEGRDPNHWALESLWPVATVDEMILMERLLYGESSPNRTTIPALSVDYTDGELAVTD